MMDEPQANDYITARTGYRIHVERKQKTRAELVWFHDVVASQ